MKNLAKTQFVIAALVSLTMLAGCGPKERKLVRVTGKITRGGEPIVLDKSKFQSLQVSFCELDADGTGVLNRFIGEIAEDGTYKADVPIAKLRVAVALYDPMPHNDTLQSTYGELTSPQIEEIKGPQTVNINIP